MIGIEEVLEARIAPRLYDAVQLAEYFKLERFVFSDRFDREIDISQIVHILGDRYPPEGFCYQRLRNGPFLGLPLQIQPYGGKRLIQLNLGYIKQNHMIAVLRKNMGDAVAHLAGTKNSNSLIIPALPL